MIGLNNEYKKPLPKQLQFGNDYSTFFKRKESSFKFGLIVGFLLACIIILSGKYVIDNYTFRSPVVIKFQNPVVRIVVPVEESKPIKPTPTPSKKKRADFGAVYASEQRETTKYDYEFLKLDGDQDAVRLLIEDRLGKAGAQLVFNESGFHPTSTNSSSGACGLFQFNPCSKLKCELSDIECQIKAGENYIINRYGTAEKALNFWLANHWY